MTTSVIFVSDMVDVVPIDNTAAATMKHVGETVPNNETSNATASSSSSSAVTATTSENGIVHDKDDATTTTTTKKWYCSIKFYVGLLLLAFIIFVIVDSITNKYVRDGLNIFLEWIEDNPVAGFFSFVIVYVIATLLFIPGSILTLGAGFVFSMAMGGLGVGVLIGTLCVVLGASIGAILAFLLGRYLLLDQVRKLSKRYAIFEALNSALETNGLKIFILLRLSPIIPFSALNYLAGALSVSFRDYVLSMFAIIPGTVLYVFLGASAGSLADSASSGGSNATVTIVIVVVGVVLGVVAIWLTTRYAKKELHRIIEERRNAESDHTADIVDTAPAIGNGIRDGDEYHDDIEAQPERKTNDVLVDGECGDSN